MSFFIRLFLIAFISLSQNAYADFSAFSWGTGFNSPVLQPGLRTVDFDNTTLSNEVSAGRLSATTNTTNTTGVCNL